MIKNENEMTWICKKIIKLDPKFFKLLNNPEFGGTECDLIFDAVAEAIENRKNIKK